MAKHLSPKNGNKSNSARERLAFNQMRPDDDPGSQSAATHAYCTTCKPQAARYHGSGLRSLHVEQGEASCAPSMEPAP